MPGVQEPHAPLEIRVGLGLALVNGNGPGSRLGDHCLGVPVRALHEPDPEGHLAVGRPSAERHQVLVAVLEVGLHHDPGLEPCELRAGEQLAYEPVRDVLDLVPLEIEPDLRSICSGALQDGHEPPCCRRDAGIGGQRRKVRGQRRWLDRNRDTAHGPEIVLFEDFVSWPSAARVDQHRDEVRKPGGVAVGLSLRMGVLTQQVDGRSTTSLPELPELSRGARGVCGDDELGRHPSDLTACYRGHETAATGNPPGHSHSP